MGFWRSEQGRIDLKDDVELRIDIANRMSWGGVCLFFGECTDRDVISRRSLIGCSSERSFAMLI